MSAALSSPVASAGRRRFWVTVLFFLIANVAAWFGYAHYDAWRHRGTLRVELFEPGENAVVGPKTAVRWRFNEDVIPTTVYGKDPGRMTPIIAGRWAWENPRTLSFIPAVDLPRATAVTFTLASDVLRSSTGASLAAPYVASIHSMPLVVKSAAQSAVLDDDQFVIELKFNDRVAPGDVLQHLTATLPDGSGVHCRVFGQATGTTVRIATDSIPPVANQAEIPVRLRVTPGLTGLSGPLGLASEYESMVTLGRSLMATQINAYAPTRARPFLAIGFNGTVSIAALRNVLTVDPPVPFTLEQAGASVELLGDFQSGTRYTAHIAAAPKGTALADMASFPRPGDLAAFVPDKGADVWFDTDQGYLSTAGNRTLIAHAVNEKAVTVSITRMYDNNLVAWRNAEESDRGTDVDSFSRPIARRTFAVNAGHNAQRDVKISLDDLLPVDVARTGVWRISIASKDDNVDSDENGNADDDLSGGYDHRSRYGGGTSDAVVTLSDIGLTAKQTHDGMVAWATSLRTAEPLAGVRIRAYSSKNQLLGEAITNTDGLARLPALHPAKEETVAVLIADVSAAPTTVPTTAPATRPTETSATELTWLDIRHTNWELGDSDISGQPYLREGHAAYVYTDRGVYRPGETLHLRAIVHGIGDVAPTKTFPVKWQLYRPDDHEWKSEVVMLTPDGGAAADIALPADLPSGQWSATISLPGAKKNGSENFGSVFFLVEDFMPNRLKVGLTMSCGDTKSPQRYSISDTPLAVDVQGDYLFGKPAASLPVDIANHAHPAIFNPTGWEDWTFGDSAQIAAIQNTSKMSAHHKSRKHAASDAQVVGDDESPDVNVLDGHGHYHGSIDVANVVHVNPDQKTGQYMGPWKLTTDVDVREVGGRAVTVSQQIAIDVLPHYIAIRQPTTNAKPGEPCELQLKLCKPDGAPANDIDADLKAEFFRDSWNTVLVYRDGRYHYDSTRVLVPITAGDVHLDAGIGSWTVTPADSGAYVAKITEPATGATTSIAFYATDGSGWNDNVDRANPEHVDLRILRAGELDAAAVAASGSVKSVAPPAFIGDTARVLISSPFTGRLLLSVETDDVVQTQVIELTSSHMVIPVKVTAACKPGAFITATVVRPIDPNAKWRTHRAFGVTRLNIDPADRRLLIAIDAPELLRPRESLDIGMKVTDPAGNAVANATVTVAAVDEGICSLTNFKTPDPLAWFTSKRALGVQSADMFGLLMPEVAKANGTRDVGGDKTADDADTGRHRSPVGARRVKPVALAWAEVHTDGEGFARASFPVPEFEGRLRVMAIGYTSSLLGCADRGVTVRSPILAQSSWPRFAAPGDRFTVPLVLFNNTNVAGDVAVSVDLLNDPATPAGLFSFDSGGSNCGSTLNIPPGMISANGQRQLNFNVTVGQAVGVAKVRVRVTLNGDTFEEETEIPVRPASPMIQFGGIAAASTRRPTTLTNFSEMMPGTGKLHVSLTPWPTLQLPKGLDYLDRYPYGCVEQTTSTCFPLIALGDIGKQLDPVQFAPDRIKAKIDYGITHLIGMQTSDGGLAMWTGETDAWPWASVYAAHFLTEAKIAGYDVPDDFYNHLLDYVRHIQNEGTDDAVKLETQAYSAYVLTLAGKPDRTVLDRLTELTSDGDRPDDPTDGHAMRGDAQLFLSCSWLLAGRRDLAEGLLPDAIPAPRTSRQSNGNLGSPIRDRALMILALEQVQPDRPELPELVQQLADEGARDHWVSTQDVAFSVLALGRYLRDMHAKTPYDSAKLKLGDTVVAAVSAGRSLSWEGESESRLQLEMTGAPGATGHLTWLQTGVPMSPPKDQEHGLKIHRRYLTLDGRPITGTVHSGDLVRVEITLEAPPSQPNLVIEDLLPAGLEIENPRLDTAAKDRSGGDAATGDESKTPDFTGRLDVQDDRVVIAGDMPDAWKAKCAYLARAITPGVYTVPPVHVEAMYDLNTNALSSSGKLIVLPVETGIAAAE